MKTNMFNKIFNIKDDYVLGPDQVNVMNVIKISLRLKQTTFLLKPDGCRYVMVGDKKKDEGFVFMKLRPESKGFGGYVLTTNHNIQYEVFLPEKYFNEIIDVVDEEIDKRREEMEREMLKNTANGLGNLLSTLEKMYDLQEKEGLKKKTEESN
jgi:hypothetical protein